jgi:CRISPR-associated exonuclease Cas4
MEELLTDELLANKEEVAARADILLSQLVSTVDDERPLPAPAEMADTALRTLALPEIATLRPHLVPELAVWAARDAYLVAGRADALAVRANKIEVALDWKSDVNPTTSIRAAYAAQLRDYLEATGAARGALVFMSLGEVVWVEPAVLS